MEQGGGWRYLRGDQQVEQFAADGVLVSRADAYGNVTRFDYETVAVADGSPERRLSRVTDVHGRSLAFTYDTVGRIATVTTPDGGTLQYHYDDSADEGREADLVRVTGADNSAVGYLYSEKGYAANPDVRHLLTGIIGRDGERFASFWYDNQGRATRTEHADGAGKIVLAFPQSGRRTVTTTDGGSYYYTFAQIQGEPRLISLQQPAGAGCPSAATQITYNDDGTVAQRTDVDGRVTTYTYDATRHLETERVEAAGTPLTRTVRTQWHDTLRLPVRIDEPGRWQIFQYDNAGQLIEHHLGGAIDPADPAAGSVDERVMRYQYNAQGQLISIKGPRTDVDDTVKFAYFDQDAAGCAESPNTCAWRRGDLQSTTNALGHTITVLRYDGAGRVLSVRDANGVQTDTDYDALGRITATHQRARIDGSASNDDATTTYTYDAAGNLSQITDADGVKVSFRYDAAHRLIGVDDALGNHIDYTLDARGLRTGETVTDASGTLRRKLTRTFDALGRVSQLTHAGKQTTKYTYDTQGRPTGMTDALNRSSSLSYDALGRAIEQLRDTYTVKARTQFTYDPLDQLRSITDPDGLVTDYVSNSLGDTLGQSSPDTGDTVFDVDAAGNVIKHTDAKGVTRTLGYDALNRVTTVRFPTATLDIIYHYDETNGTTGCANSYPIGRLTRVEEGSTITTYCYDAAGRVIAKTQAAPTDAHERPVRGPAFGSCPAGRPCHHGGAIGTASMAVTTAGDTVSDTVRYTYTRAGRLLSVAYPDGALVTYLRDAAGRVSGIDLTAPDGSQREAVQSVSYLPFGPIASYTLGNGQTITRTYDADYRLTDLTSAALNLHYARDAVGNITAVGDVAGANPAQESYLYDRLDRLTNVKDASGKVLESYTYNATGDRLSKTAAGLATGTYVYQNDTHWLTGIGSDARSYDASGNTIGATLAGDTYGYGYDDRGRMTVVQRNASTAATYVYNAWNQRIGKITPNEGLRYQYNENSQLLIEYGGQTEKDYIWLDDLPVAVIDTHATDQSLSTVSYVHADGLNTPRAVANEDGDTIWAWSSINNPFGEQQPTSTVGYVYNLRFPGQYYDAESGLHYNMARFYDPLSGRYGQADPLGYGGGQASWYAYVGGNPINLTDSGGLACDQRGCWVTPVEQAYADAGNYTAYYQTACSNRDRYACRAGEVAANKGFLAGITNTRLSNSILSNSKEKTCSAAMADMEKRMDAIRVALARAHASALSGATPSNPKMLDRVNDIGAFHNRVFEKYGAGPVFGGATYDALFGRGGFGYDWCPSPSCKP
jgi:RHS repeat-associated protein